MSFDEFYIIDSLANPKLHLSFLARILQGKCHAESCVSDFVP